MPILTPDELENAIAKYRKQHPRTNQIRWDGEHSPLETYVIDQPGLDIIETLLARVGELERQRNGIEDK